MKAISFLQYSRGDAAIRSNGGSINIAIGFRLSHILCRVIQYFRYLRLALNAK